MSDDTEDEYTPPTMTVRYAYSMHSFGPQSKTNAEFDRWLAARDRENRAIGWDEGASAAHRRLLARVNDEGLIDLHALIKRPPNPYRGDNR